MTCAWMHAHIGMRSDFGFCYAACCLPAPASCACPWAPPRSEIPVGLTSACRHQPGVYSAGTVILRDDAATQYNGSAGHAEAALWSEQARRCKKHKTKNDVLTVTRCVHVPWLARLRMWRVWCALCHATRSMPQSCRAKT